MKKRISVGFTAICWSICLLVLASLLPIPAVAQGCEDCQIIKKGVPATTPGVAAPTAAGTAAVQPTAAFLPAASVARLILYWSEGCGHCHEILDGLLPGLKQKYGPQLEARLVEVVSMEDIASFFDVAEGYGFARGRAAVPFLLIGDRALMGVEQIERELPGLIETYLAAGGVDWPDLTARNVTPEPASTASGICGIATPCESDAAAAFGAPTGGAAPARNSPAPFLASMGLAAVVGGSLAFILGRRAARGRARSASSSTCTSLPTNGDDAAT